jgi:hypothetical protein
VLTVVGLLHPKDEVLKCHVFLAILSKLKLPSNRKRTIENISLGSHDAYFVSSTDGHWIYGPPTDDHYDYYNQYNLNNLVDGMNSLGKIRHFYFGSFADDWGIIK